MATSRGNDIAMTFQDPMKEPGLHHRPSAEQGMRLHLGYSKDQAMKRSIELLTMVGIPNAEQRARTTRTSSPAACASAS